MKNEIRNIRGQSGITMTQLAITAGISTSSLSLIEREQSCRKATARRICDALSELAGRELAVGEVFKGAEFKR